MKALLLGSGASTTPIAADLTGAGHQVVRCASTNGPAFPCVGLHGTCPLDASVDVAVVVHDDHGQPLEMNEVGVICALRDGVPLVVAGNGTVSPWGEFVDAVAAGRRDVLPACDRAITASLQRRAREVGAGLDRHGDVVHATLPAGSSEADAVRTHRSLRQSFPDARVIDVSVGDEATGTPTAAESPADDGASAWFG